MISKWISKHSGRWLVIKIRTAAQILWSLHESAPFMGCVILVLLKFVFYAFVRRSEKWNGIRLATYTSFTILKEHSSLSQHHSNETIIKICKEIKVCAPRLSSGWCAREAQWNCEKYCDCDCENTFRMQRDVTVLRRYEWFSRNVSIGYSMQARFRNWILSTFPPLILYNEPTQHIHFLVQKYTECIHL